MGVYIRLHTYLVCEYNKLLVKDWVSVANANANQKRNQNCSLKNRIYLADAPINTRHSIGSCVCVCVCLGFYICICRHTAMLLRE